MYALDSEEKWYADFSNNRGVESHPDFIDSFNFREGVYQAAVAEKQVCQNNLKTELEAYKDVQLEFGKYKHIYYFCL